MTRAGSVLTVILIIQLIAVPGRAEPTVPANPTASNASELWIVNTRCVSSCSEHGFDDPAVRFQRFDGEDRWIDVDRRDFFATGSADVPTSFVIHGNQVDSCEAIQRGHALRRLLECAAPDRPFRVVVWSWPAGRVTRSIRDDVRIKAARSDVEAFGLAQCVERISPDVPVAMVGHSFGARVITGALHLLAGGELACRRLEPRDDRPRRAVRAVLFAAAVDNGSLLPGWRNGEALDEVERMLVVRNGNDRILRWYPRMYGRGGPEALGFTGPACVAQVGENRDKIEILDASCSVGRGHGWFEYLCGSSLHARLPWFAFLEPEAESQP
ncbi:MAG: hypothetical protein GX621_01435 [Pirellulaceae bacterium]|nr:hypothetical protein [Pirellulaceae bacterium]